MGGVGSGKRSGKKPKVTTERLPSIDIRLLRKQGYLIPDTDGELTWSVGGKPVCSVRYRMYLSKMVINYNHRSKDGHWVPAKQEIIFDQTQCNYGGGRQWFLCGNCNRRVAVLYFGSGGFFCRHCLNLTYASQQENEEHRMMRKARNIRQRLGAGDNLFAPIWEKPKNMHQTTFDRLRREADYAHSLSWEAVGERFAKYT